MFGPWVHRSFCNPMRKLLDQAVDLIIVKTPPGLVQLLGRSLKKNPQHPFLLSTETRLATVLIRFMKFLYSCQVNSTVHMAYACICSKHQWVHSNCLDPALRTAAWAPESLLGSSFKDAWGSRWRCCYCCYCCCCCRCCCCCCCCCCCRCRRCRRCCCCCCRCCRCRCCCCCCCWCWCRCWCWYCCKLLLPLLWWRAFCGKVFFTCVFCLQQWGWW